MAFRRGGRPRSLQSRTRYSSPRNGAGAGWPLRKSFPRREMVLLMTCQIAFVMAVAIRATLVMVALMMRVRSALRCMPVMVRTVLPHRGLPRTMAVVRAIGKGRDAQHTG